MRQPGSAINHWEIVLQSENHHLESRADSLYTAGHFHDAAELYSDLARREPGRLDIHVRLGRLALLHNYPGQAIEHFATVLNNGLRSMANWEMLADAYLQNDEPGQAALCYERAGRSGLAGTLAVMASLDVRQVTGPVDSVELEWLTGPNLPLVKIEVNGYPLNLLVDTAASDLVLDEKSAIAAGVPHGGSETRFFAGGLSSKVTYGYIEKLKLGELAVQHILTQHLDLQDRLARFTPGVPVHGILGLSVLSRFTTSLDFMQGCLRLSTVRDIRNRSSPEITTNALPMWIADHQFILLQAQMRNTQTGLWAVDTGMSGAAVAISSATAEAAGLTRQVGMQEAGMGGGGAVEGQRVRLPGLRLGAVERQDVEGILLQSFPLQDRLGFRLAGMLAADFFHGARLSLDFSRMQLTLDQPDQSSYQ